MQNHLDELIRLVVKRLNSGDDLDKDYFYAAGTTWTKRELIKELRDQTEFGLDLVAKLLISCLDEVSKGKEIV